MSTHLSPEPSIRTDTPLHEHRRSRPGRQIRKLGQRHRPEPLRRVGPSDVPFLTRLRQLLRDDAGADESLGTGHLVLLSNDQTRQGGLLLTPGTQPIMRSDVLAATSTRAGLNPSNAAAVHRASRSGHREVKSSSVRARSLMGRRQHRRHSASHDPTGTRGINPEMEAMW